MDLRIVGIDWQNDFVDKKGSLCVPGGDMDAHRFAQMVLRLKDKIVGIHATMDCHPYNHIAHPPRWINSNGEHPSIADFYKGKPTIITEDNMSNGEWMASSPLLQKLQEEYVKALRANGRYLLCIWPPHCLIGSWGNNIYPEVFDAFCEWENIKPNRQVDYRVKGSNANTEHYSPIMADVPDTSDPSTMLQTGKGSLIQITSDADIVAITGQALSHCLANCVRDIANNFGEENIKKLWLIEDCSSSVGGFEQLGTDFVKEMVGRGMNIVKSTEFLK